MIRGLATNDSFRNVLKQESVQSLPTYAQNIPPGPSPMIYDFYSDLGSERECQQGYVLFGSYLDPFVICWSFHRKCMKIWVVVSNIFLFSPLFGEDSHFD